MSDTWVMTDKELAAAHGLWREFRDEWPVERLRTMTLEQYTNLDKDSAFVYLIEAKLNDLGSIWGNTAFKWGIYRRADTKDRETTTTHAYGAQYGWLTKYGASEEAAYEAVRANVVTVAEAASAGELERVDRVDLFPLFKWKLAFLYQDPFDWRLFPVYSNAALLWLYRHHIDPSAKNKTPYSLRYQALRDRFSGESDPIQLARRLWNAYTGQHQYWVLNLEGVETAAGIGGEGEVRLGDLPEAAERWFLEEEVAEGDEIATAFGERVVARGVVLRADEEDTRWSSHPLELKSPFRPTSGLSAVTEPAHRAALFGAEVEPAPPPRPTRPATNLILYGPPGTGKTFATVTRALDLALGTAASADRSRETQVMQFRQLQQEGRVELVTFHQAYGYEEFVEGLRPVLGDSTGEVRYELHPGVLKRIALRAAAAGLRSSNEEPEFEALWRQLIDKVRVDEDWIYESASGREYTLRVSARGNFESYAVERDPDDEPVVTERKQSASQRLCRLWWEHRNELGAAEEMTYEKGKDIHRRAFGGEGGHHYTAIWIVYRELLALRDEQRVARAELRPSDAQVQDALDRGTPGKLDFEFSGLTEQFVLIIDEINRGNVSKVLGELITLLEPDKRLSMPNELKLPLTYSPAHRFALPPNLHVIGTMNTADRSIALMDVALRRRFEFEEVMPDPAALREVLRDKVTDEAFVDLVVAMLETLNTRVRFLYDREHQLGHAYFMAAVSYDALRRLLAERILPLLQEYFYGSWDKIATVLGCPYDERGKPRRGGVVTSGGSYRHPIVEAHVLSERAVLGFEADQYDKLIDHRVADVLRRPASPADLLPYFLSALELSAEERAERERALRAGSLFS